MSPARVFADGVLVIDKPSGPTSHDVVAVVRRAVKRVNGSQRGVTRTCPAEASQERRRKRDSAKADLKVGHTGTLDPIASGVLPLVIGKATRLARFLSSAEKEYEADIQLGVSTTTFDRTGDVLPRQNATRVSDVTERMIDEVVTQFRGTYQQQPPAFSAKKIEGDRAYDLARRNTHVNLQPVTVTASTLDVLEWRGSSLRLRLRCSAGYYVRSLADAIGEKLGTGAHLAALVRTRSGDFSLADAVGLDVVVERSEMAADRIVPLTRLLPGLPAVTLTPQGAALAVRGGFLSASHVNDTGVLSTLPARSPVRLLHADGRLLAIGEILAEGPDDRTRHLLHPGVVLE